MFDAAKTAFSLRSQNAQQQGTHDRDDASERDARFRHAHAAARAPLLRLPFPLALELRL